jgi:hypothetical protein
MPRKRFNAFDDFPVDPKNKPDWQPGESSGDVQPDDKPILERDQPHARANSLFHDRHVLAQPEVPQVERIERLKPSQMVPDRFQPRRLLPTALRQLFYSGKIDCYQAARQWLQMARSDEGIQGQIENLLNMGSSFREHGQIKPITGSWVETGEGSYIFQIETGERRFWAACLQTVSQGLKEEPLLRVEVVAAPTRMRQVIENRHAEPPSAVGQACEIASLILAELGIAPQGDEPDEFDYFRQANKQRMPPGLWDKIIPIMNVTRSRMVQKLDILDLPTPLLELADRYRVPERVLREVLDAPPEQWESLLRTSITKNLTSDDVAELTDKRPAGKGEKRGATPPDPVRQAMNSFKRFNDAMVALDEDTQSAILDELANDLVITDQAENIMALLRDLSERIRIRQQNRYRRR